MPGRGEDSVMWKHKAKVTKTASLRGLSHFSRPRFGLQVIKSHTEQNALKFSSGALRTPRLAANASQASDKETREAQRFQHQTTSRNRLPRPRSHRPGQIPEFPAWGMSRLAQEQGKKGTAAVLRGRESSQPSPGHCRELGRAHSQIPGTPGHREGLIPKFPALQDTGKGPHRVPGAPGAPPAVALPVPGWQQQRRGQAGASQQKGRAGQGRAEPSRDRRLLPFKPGLDHSERSFGCLFSQMSGSGHGAAHPRPEPTLKGFEQPGLTLWIPDDHSGDHKTPPATPAPATAPPQAAATHTFPVYKYPGGKRPKPSAVPQGRSRPVPCPRVLF